MFGHYNVDAVRGVERARANVHFDLVGFGVVGQTAAVSQSLDHFRWLACLGNDLKEYSTKSAASEHRELATKLLEEE